MAVSDSSKVDLLYKKLFGVTKTDTSTNKGAGNESIASPALIRGDKVWTDAASIPATAAPVTNVVQAYLTTSRIECSADTTTTPVSSVYPTWKTNLTNWISPEFGSTYFVKVYAETAGNSDPTNGISLSDSGSGGTGEWYFDYQSGVLNFIGGTIPAALTASKVIYITGYRYIGGVGITSQANANNANTANTVLSISNFTTANLAEGTNLYYTNSRVASNVIALLPTLAGSGIQIQANGQINATATSGTSVTSTSNVAEGSNLYYTNSRVYSNVAQMSINVFADVDITGITTNGILTWNGSAFVAGTVGGAATANSALIAYQADHANTADRSNIANTVLALTGLTTSNLLEGTNLYFTNSRVYSNVIALLPTLAGSGIQIQANGQINANATSLSLATLSPYLTTSNVAEGSNLYYTNARVYSAIVSNLALKANVTDLTTANVSELTNLYYTNSRVISAVLPYLTTSNVAEGSNLYYTNARVLSALTGNLVIGNLVTGTSVSNSYVTAGNVNAGNLIATTLVFGSASGGSITGANLVSATNIQGNTWIGIYTANVIESNTALYYTNARAVLAVVPYLTTANVTESASNLYFTNARVFANVAQMSINVFADVDITGITTNGILSWNGTAFVAGTVGGAATSNSALVAYQADHANTADRSNIANTVLALTGLTTSNLLEGTNLYFTNARAAIGLTGLNVSVNDLYAAGNLTVQGDFTTLNVATLDIEDKNITLGKGLTTSAQADGAGITVDGAQANITYLVTGDKFVVNKNLEVLGDVKANTWTGLYSANVIESTNQYFTNTRAVLAITPYLTTANVLESASNLYYSNARVSANLELQSINVFADVDISGINNDELLLWNSTSRVFRPSSFTGKLTTANVVELTNLYFTNARVFTALSDGTANLSIYNLTTNGLLTVSSGSSGESITGIEFKNNPAGGTGDTAKIQYYAANIGVNDDTILEISVANNAGDSINLKTTGGGVGVNVARPVAEFDVAGNINARNSLIFSSVVVGPTAQFNAVTANTWNNLYTSNVVEGNNLYYTNARVLAYITPYLTTANVIESASNLYFTNARALAAVQSSLVTNTSNIAEGSNLYYTNSRVISAITPYLTTANVTELNNQYFTNARVFANVAQMSVNVFADVDITGVSTGYSLIWNGSQFIASAPTSVASTANTAGFAYIANVANSVVSINNFTTANLNENGNLYYTNSRVLSALTGNVTIGNVKVSTAINYSNITGVTKVYQYFNDTTQSLDTIFI